MKKLLFISLLVFCMHSYSAVIADDDDAVTTANTNNIVRQTMMASLAAQEVQRQEANAQAASNIQQVAIQASNKIIKGVLVCSAWYEENANDDYNYHGCEISYSKYLSIQEYFNLYKPSYARSITMVVFDTNDNTFDIYYN